MGLVVCEGSGNTIALPLAGRDLREMHHPLTDQWSPHPLQLQAGSWEAGLQAQGSWEL